MDNPELGLNDIVFKRIATQENTLTDKVCNKAISWRVIQVVGIVPLAQLTLRHDAYMISDGKCLELIMRDQYRGNAITFEYLANFVRQLYSALGILTAERFIKE